MLLEAFFSTVASNVFTEIFKRVTGNKPLKAEDIKRIIVDTLQSQHLAGQAQGYEREIIIVLNGAGVVDAGGQFLLSSHKFPAPGELVRAWWYDKEYKIVSVFTEKVIDAPRNEQETGLPLILWDYHGGKNQQWKIIPVGDDADLFKIQSPYSSMVLDVPEPRMDDGTQIIQFGYHGGTNQQWRLERVK
jgi:hypothetical protein